MQFQAGAKLVASLTDDDGTPSNIRWQWYRSSSKTAQGTDGHQQCDLGHLHRAGQVD